MEKALTRVQKTELSQKFCKDKDFEYLSRKIEPAVAEDGYVARPLRYVAAEAQEQGLLPGDEERKSVESHWLRRFKVQPWDLKREEKVREFAVDWWVFKTICESYDCPIHTEYGPQVEKFWTTSGLQTLTPIFFDTNVQIGILANPVLDRLVRDTVPIQSHTATHLESTTTAADLQAGVTGEGAPAIMTNVSSVERTIQLKEFASELDVTWEVTRLQRTNFLATQIQRYTQLFLNYITDFAMAALIDGTGSTAITDVPAAGGGIYTDLIDLEMAFTQGYMPDTIVAPKQVMTKILKMQQYQDPLAGILHQTTGAMPNPLGMDLVRWDSSGFATGYASTNLVMFDSNLSLTEYTEGGLIVRSEDVIRTGWTRTVSRIWVGFGVWDRAAARRGTGW